MIRTFVEGHPVAQPRPRVNTRRGRPRIYTPSTKGLKAWRDALMLEAQLLRRTAAPNTLHRALSVELRFYIGRPKSHYTKGGNLKSRAPRYHVQKPDIDNLIKPVLDVITKAGVWIDDTHISGVDARKDWADLEREGVCIKIWETIP